MGLAGATALGTLFPPGVVVEVATEADADAPLCDEETPHVAQAIPARVKEFRQGRAAARRALDRLGFPPAAIPAGPDRAPRWPKGTVGTIAHTAGRCLAGLATTERFASIGLDVEWKRQLPEGVRAHVCTLDELAWIDRQPDGYPWDLVTFVAKEAFYKAWYPVTGTCIGFHDVAVVFQSTGAFMPVAAGGHCRTEMLGDYAGRWALEGGFVYAAAWIAAAAPGCAPSATPSG